MAIIINDEDRKVLIQQLTKNGYDIYPLTSTKAVFDSEGHSIDDKLLEVNLRFDKFEYDVEHGILGKINIMMRINYEALMIQWKYEPDEEWEDLIPLADFDERYVTKSLLKEEFNEQLGGLIHNELDPDYEHLAMSIGLGIELEKNIINGVKGDRGPMGATGPRGFTGPTGPIGKMGPTGLKGDRGEQGHVRPTGLRGEKGDTGEIGPIGFTGAKGDVGPTGPLGPTGPTGPQGDPFLFENFTEDQLTNLIGPTGRLGPIGPTGPQGDPFLFENFTEDQLVNLVGPTGPTGPIGETGPKGKDANVITGNVSDVISDLSYNSGNFADIINKFYNQYYKTTHNDVFGDGGINQRLYSVEGEVFNLKNTDFTATTVGQLYQDGYDIFVNDNDVQIVVLAEDIYYNRLSIFFSEKAKPNKLYRIIVKPTDYDVYIDPNSAVTWSRMLTLEKNNIYELRLIKIENKIYGDIVEYKPIYNSVINITYGNKNNLEHSISKICHGSIYKNTVLLDSPSSVVVTVNGEDVTSTAYNSETKEIRIENPKGNIHVFVE